MSGELRCIIASLGCKEGFFFGDNSPLVLVATGCLYHDGTWQRPRAGADSVWGIRVPCCDLYPVVVCFKVTVDLEGRIIQGRHHHVLSGLWSNKERHDLVVQSLLIAKPENSSSLTVPEVTLQIVTSVATLAFPLTYNYWEFFFFLVVPMEQVHEYIATDVTRVLDHMPERLPSSFEYLVIDSGGDSNGWKPQSTALVATKATRIWGIIHGEDYSTQLYTTGISIVFLCMVEHKPLDLTIPITERLNCSAVYGCGDTGLGDERSMTEVSVKEHMKKLVG
ncbi:hypothetical protein Tco_0206518 [Tanacetum coccineum]